jgi:hypothetical protein
MATLIDAESMIVEGGARLQAIQARPSGELFSSSTQMLRNPEQEKSDAQKVQTCVEDDDDDDETQVCTVHGLKRAKTASGTSADALRVLIRIALKMPEFKGFFSRDVKKTKIIVIAAALQAMGCRCWSTYYRDGSRWLQKNMQFCKVLALNTDLFHSDKADSQLPGGNSRATTTAGNHTRKRRNPSPFTSSSAAGAGAYKQPLSWTTTTTTMTAAAGQRQYLTPSPVQTLAQAASLARSAEGATLCAPRPVRSTPMRTSLSSSASTPTFSMSPSSAFNTLDTSSRKRQRLAVFRSPSATSAFQRPSGNSAAAPRAPSPLDELLRAAEVRSLSVPPPRQVSGTSFGSSRSVGSLHSQLFGDERAATPVILPPLGGAASAFLLHSPSPPLQSPVPDCRPQSASSFSTKSSTMVQLHRATAAKSRDDLDVASALSSWASSSSSSSSSSSASPSTSSASSSMRAFTPVPRAPPSWA